MDSSAGHTEQDPDYVLLERQLLQLLGKKSFYAVHLLCGADRWETSATSDLVLSLYQRHERKLLPLIRSLLAKEIANTAQESTLFRSGSAMKILSRLLSAKSKEYLGKVLGEPLLQICRKPPYVELDPYRLGEEGGGGKQDDAAANLTALCSNILTVIINSADQVPLFVKQVASMLHQTAVSRFPDSKQINEKYSDVGGLIFLRLFCVAIVQPEEMIGERPSENARRALILLSKVLQTLANGVEFSAKAGEEYMTVMNGFLQNNQSAIVSYLKHMSSLDVNAISGEDEDKEGDAEKLPALNESFVETLKRLMIKIHERRDALSEGFLQNGCKEQAVVLENILEKWSLPLLQPKEQPSKPVGPSSTPIAIPAASSSSPAKKPLLKLPFHKMHKTSQNNTKAREDVKAQLDALKEQRRKLDEQIAKLEAEWEEMSTEMSTSPPEHKEVGVEFKEKEKGEKKRNRKIDLLKQERMRRRQSTGQIAEILQDMKVNTNGNLSGVSETPHRKPQVGVLRFDAATNFNKGEKEPTSPLDTPTKRRSSHGDVASTSPPGSPDLHSGLHNAVASSSDEIPYLDALPLTPRRKKKASLAATKDSPLFASNIHVLSTEEQKAPISRSRMHKTPKEVKKNTSPTESVENVAASLKKKLGKKNFTGQELVEWVQANTQQKEEESATVFCEKLLRHGCVKQTRRGSFLGKRLNSSAPAPAFPDKFGPESIFECG